ncbi:cold-regulated 413 inner membrane protein 1, chloroplastic-like [Phragmites australis]|uniref:cold-regulated 413 inner membrane protein 1, chloroplastic-like n=1 Tax=Phragmites australis TaxID=29695 RepID=UPI002D76711B|nr:cold-regulated 413 inner membrane protein 1, chloroplastic-like [Phragmites australis]
MGVQLRRCASLRMRPSSGRTQRWRCWRLAIVSVCCASAHLCTETLQWSSVTATATLMLATGTTIHKSFLVPLIALQAPSSAISWIKGDYGQRIAFLGLLVRLLYFIPGEVELLLSTMLLVIIAPYQFLNLRGSQGGAILSSAIAAYLAFQHFTGLGGFRKAFDREAIIATLCIVCMTVITLMLAF